MHNLGFSDEPKLELEGAHTGSKNQGTGLAKKQPEKKYQKASKLRTNEKEVTIETPEN